MYEADIERLEAQARRVRQAATELLDNAEALDRDNNDISQSNLIEGNQQELVDATEQLLADGAAVLDNSGNLDRRPEYNVDSNTFSVSEQDGVSTITYNGDVERTATDLNVSVTLDGTVQNTIKGTLTPSDTFTVDVSSASNSLVVSWTSSVEGDKFTLPSQAQSPVDRSQLPSPNTLPKSREHSTELTL